MLLNVYCTHRDPATPGFPHELRGRRDRSDPQLAGHLRGLAGYVMRNGERPMTQTRYHVLRHAERVRHHFAIEVAQEHMSAFAAWAREANAIAIAEDGSVRAPDGAVLVDPRTGEAQPDAELPYPDAAILRRERTRGVLAARGIAVVPTLPPVVGEVEVELRTPGEVAARALALFACAVRAESLATGDPMPTADIAARLPPVVAALTPRERAFWEQVAPSEVEVRQHAWRYEAAATLAFALGLVPELAWPDQICDVPGLATRFLELDAERLVRDATLIDASAILDHLDLQIRLHWAIREAHARQRPLPDGIEPGVVAERHYALNWLTRFEDADWDNVDTPT